MIFRPTPPRTFRSSRSSPPSDQRRERPCLWLRRLRPRTAAPATARVRGWASYTWGRAEREATGALSVRVPTVVMPSRRSRRTAFGIAGSSASTTRVASGFPRTPPLGLRVASGRPADGDGDGNREELVPARDAAGRSIYAVDFGGVGNLNTARLPLFARVDLRVTWRPRGAQGGGSCSGRSSTC